MSPLSATETATATEAQPAQGSQIFVLPDGRSLGYAVYGSPPSPDIATIVYFHGFPGSRIEAAFIATTKHELCVVAMERPGMGLSTFQPSRKIMDWPSDVLALTEHLKIEQFHVIGDSGGSPYALVCAKDIPSDRLLSASVISGIYPFSLGTEGMLFGVWAILAGSYWLPQAVVKKLLDWEFGNAARNPDPKVFEDVFMKGMAKKGEKEMACLDDLKFRKIVIESMREAFRQGSDGAAWDCRLYNQWGFELDELNGKNIILWHGMQDVNAPYAMALKASRRIKGSTLKTFENETHLSLPYHHLEELLGVLLELGKHL
jgi:pimeloyl-ACP methyl ester carboxylesterase